MKIKRGLLSLARGFNPIVDTPVTRMGGKPDFQKAFIRCHDLAVLLTLGHVGYEYALWPDLLDKT